MHTATTGRTRPVIDRRNNRAVRDIAKLRARRAARLAAESAAGRRRMVVTGVCAPLDRHPRHRYCRDLDCLGVARCSGCRSGCVAGGIPRRGCPLSACFGP